LPLRRRVPHHPDRRHPSGGRHPVGDGRGIGREELPLPPRECAAAGCPAPSPPAHAVAASLAWARALKACLPSDERVIHAAVARSRWDLRRAAAWRRKRHTLVVEGKGRGSVGVSARSRLCHLSGPVGGGGDASTPSSAAAPALVFCCRRRRRVFRPSSLGAYRVGEGLSTGGPLPRTGRHAA